MREFFEGLLRRATIAGEAPALVSPAGVLSYAVLVDRLRAHAQWAARLPRRAGLLFAKGPDQVVCDLALSFAGIETVPLPEFHSDSQLSHIVAAAQVSDVVADAASVERARRLGVTVHALGAVALPAAAPAPDAARIVFTSGTTGKPKGVRLGGRQMLASVAALTEASRASAADHYLSLLPGALLLEQIAGAYLPLSVGAAIHMPFADAPDVASPGSAIALAAHLTQATATVLVPELLAAWLKELQGGTRPPSSLRFVAVGGAPVSPQLAAAAWRHGLPVYEGYGLSECSSVVAVNRPHAQRPGTVGRPLPGVTVVIEQGEIVVDGPTVMSGYVGEPPISGPWRTGDLGRFDSDGYLIVTGRKDDVIVTDAGRNVSPEWVEDAILADERIRRCVVIEQEGELAALVVPRDAALCANETILNAIVRSACRSLPDYARPRRHLAIRNEEFERLDLLTANLRPRRAAARQVLIERSPRPQVQPVGADQA